MTVAVWVWIGLLVLFIIAEAATAQMVSIWFIAGAIVASICAAFNLSVVIQIVAFLVVSVLLIVFLRPLAKKKLTPKIIPTNADMVIGKVAVVKETVDNTQGQGRVAVDGIDWTARSYYGDVIAEGDRAVVYAIDGVKLIIVPIKED